MAVSLPFCPNTGRYPLVDLVNQPTVLRPSIHLHSGAMDSDDDCLADFPVRNNGCSRGRESNPRFLAT